MDEETDKGDGVWAARMGREKRGGRDESVCGGAGPNHSKEFYGDELLQSCHVLSALAPRAAIRRIATAGDPSASLAEVR